METAKLTGTIDKTVLKMTYEESKIEWKISDITMINKTKDLGFYYKSPSFFINDVSCFLRLHPKSALKEEFTRLFIQINVEQEFSPEYNISLKKLDGSVEHLVSGIPKKIVTSLFDMGNIIKRSELLERKSELAPHDVLTIICRFKYELTDLSDKTMPIKLIKLDTLSENFKRLFANNDNCDTTLNVMDKEYKAHRAVLIARSPVFAAMFQHETTEKQMGIINIPDCDPESFEEFLKFLYCGKLEELSFRSALHLYETSDKYEVIELKTFCAEYLMENLTVENVCDVAIMANKYVETNLLDAAQKFFNKNRDDIFETSEWDSLVLNNYRLSKKMLKRMSSKMKLVE